MTNHVSIDFVNRWEQSKSSLKAFFFFFFCGILLNLSFSISTINLFFNLFLCLVFVIYVCLG